MQNQTQLPDLESMMFNPWVQIWYKPRQTIRRILDSNPERSVLLPGALAGAENILNQASSRSWGDSFGLTWILGLTIVVGPMLGLLGLFISGAWLRWTGSWFGGQANSEQVRAAIAWSSAPGLVSLALWIPRIILFGNDLFTTQTPRLEANPLLALALLPFVFAQIVLAIWGAILQVKTLAEVHRFSAWRSLGAIFLPALVILVPITICAVWSLISRL